MQHLFLTPALLRTQQTVWLCSCYCMRFAGRSLISCAPQMVFSSIVLRRGALGLYRWPLHSAMASLAYRHASTSAVVLSESRRLRQAGLHARRQSAATAAAGAASAASPPAEEAPYPTYVPRNPGITDGAWNQRDAESVALAEQNAEAVAVASRRGDQSEQHDLHVKRNHAHPHLSSSHAPAR